MHCDKIVYFKAGQTLLVNKVYTPTNIQIKYKFIKASLDPATIKFN